MNLPRWIRYIFVGTGYFCFCFPFKMWGFDPRYFIILIGFVLFLQEHKWRIRTSVPVFYFKVLSLPAAIGVWALISVFYNHTSDLTFVIYPFQCLYLLLIAYSVFLMQKSCFREISFRQCVNFYIGILVVQSLIALTAFVNTGFAGFLYSMEGMDQQSAVMKNYLGMRLIGLGCFFFGAGSHYGLGLILFVTNFLSIKGKKTWKQCLAYALLYIYLIVVGMGFARTTSIGLMMSMFLLLAYPLFFPGSRTLRNNVRKYVIITMSILATIVSVYLMSPKLQEEYGTIVEFAFEMVYKYFEEGEVATDSSDALKTLYVWPDNLKTYLIGDARFWADSSRESYYMFTDVGYLRLIYYFGIPGMLVYLGYTLYMCVECCRYTEVRLLRFTFLLIFIFDLALNVKGLMDMSATMYVYLLVLRATYSKRRNLSDNCGKHEFTGRLRPVVKPMN